MIRGLVSMMETSPDIVGPINLGNPNELSVRKLAEVILELTGSRSKIVHRSLPADDPQKRRPDISEAERLLAWRPTTPLKEGLARTIPYFEGLLAEGKIPRAASMTGAEELGSGVER
jgi:UDP-glucuronate decarboxylase